MNSSPLYSLFIPCPRGLENVLTQELTQLGCTRSHSSEGGVKAQGHLDLIYRINLHSRVASRVLIQLASGTFEQEEDIYRLACGINWPDWFDVEKNFKIHIEGKQTHLRSLNFAALKVKDAICDVFRQKTNSRPSVEKFRPDIRIHIFVEHNEVLLYLDSSGEALFKRGYRQDTGEAPLRENLAAGLLLLAGYNGSQPFIDPFCGSGTIAIEAALIACHRAPGLKRTFGFTQLKNYDHALWQQIHQQAQQDRKSVV